MPARESRRTTVPELTTLISGLRNESMGRHLAAVISHAPGFSAMPSFGPEFERSHQGVLGQFFCDADIVGDSGNGGDEPCGVDLPHGLHRLRHNFHAC
jgi:hypothetical protein